ncbi:FAD-dependent oxidoreductase, partial [Methylobacterium organophilum]|nr:FAD-dependent oxidoreductase [Methylobacterium organophilum]
MAQERVVVIGAGIGGLAAALRLAHAGIDTTVLERAPHPGGKMRAVPVGDRAVEAGPTVFTMRWVFDELFAECGAELGDRVALAPARLLARHAWSRDERLDLFADIDASADAIAALAGPREAEGYRRFCARSAEVYRTLEGPFIREGRTGPAGLAQRVGLSGLGDLWRIQPFATLWSALGAYFRDPRLRQLFGRYATYCGASPFTAPATLMLVAHVEQAGVWTVAGGLSGLARAVADLAAERGATFRYGAEVARILTDGGRVTGVRLTDGATVAADHVVCNADCAALGAGLLGPAPGAGTSAPARQRSGGRPGATAHAAGDREMREEPVPPAGGLRAHPGLHVVGGHDDAAGLRRPLPRDGRGPLRTGGAGLGDDLQARGRADGAAGPVPRGGLDPSGSGRADGDAVGAAGSGSDPGRPRFDGAVARGGYAWWYVDAVSDDGRQGLTIIAFIGSVFSPYYAWSAEKDPFAHCAMNVVLYGDRGRFAMTERRAASLSRSADHIAVGPSAMH